MGAGDGRPVPEVHGGVGGSSVARRVVGVALLLLRARGDEFLFQSRRGLLPGVLGSLALTRVVLGGRWRAVPPGLGR